MESYQNMIIIIFLVQNFYFTVFWQKKYYHKNKNHQWQSISNLHRYHNILAAFFFFVCFYWRCHRTTLLDSVFPISFCNCVVLTLLSYHFYYYCVELNIFHFQPTPKNHWKNDNKKSKQIIHFLYWLPQNKWNWLLAVMRLRLLFAFFSFNISFTKKKSRMRLNDGKSIRLSILLNVSWFNLDEKKQKIW